ncbi:MAG: hypothetical protein O3B01_03810 [Planctomycetota bacterium]|nr:hypothetical protein [Planctomycetota bacterium]
MAFQPRQLSRETPLPGLQLVASKAVKPALEAFNKRLRAVGINLDLVGEEAPRDRHSLVAGNLQTHSWIKDLYFRSWLCTDALHPGPEGFELKTLCSPFAPQVNILLVGVSDEAGLEAGLDRLSAILTRHSEQVPFLFEASTSDEVLFLREAEAEGRWPTGLSSGAYAVYTGEPGLAEAFKNFLLEGNPLPPEQIAAAVVLYRLLEPLDLWDENARQSVLDQFHEFATGTNGINRFGELDSDLPGRFKNPMTVEDCRCALATYFIADYFHQFHELPEAAKWLVRVQRIFESQAKFVGCSSDSPNIRWNVIAQNIARYALASDNVEFLGSEFRESILRGLQCFTNQGQHPLYGKNSVPGSAAWVLYGMAAALYEDGTFLAPFRYWDQEMSHALLPWHSGDEPLRSFAIKLEEKHEPSLIGIRISDLDPIFCPDQESRYFDKISFRSGLRREDDYLLLDGFSGGEHSYESANCIKEMHMRGFPWLISADTGLREASLAAQNGVLLIKDGQRGIAPKYAKVLDSHFLASGGHVVTRMNDYSGADWTRSIFWRASGFVLVIDEIEVNEPGRFQMETRWTCLGDPVPGRWLAFEMEDKNFQRVRLGVGWEEKVEAEMETLDLSNEAYSYYVDQNYSEYDFFPTVDLPAAAHRIRLRKIFDGKPGERASIATRFVCTQANEKGPSHLERDTTVIFVEVPGEKVEEFPFVDNVQPISLDKEIQESRPEPILHPRKPSALTLDCSREHLLIGYEDGHLKRIQLSSDETVTEDNLEGRIEAITTLMVGGRVYYYAGTSEGDFVCFGPQGERIWTKRIEVSESDISVKLVSGWSTHQPCVRALASKSVGNQPVLIAGYGDGHLRRITPLEGTELWEQQLPGGTAAHILLADITGNGRTEVAVGTSNPSVHGFISLFTIGGERLPELKTEWDSDWSMPTEMTALLAADIDRDGRIEIIRGAANSTEHVTCWRGATPLWSHDTGEYPTVLCAIPGNRILVGSRSGWILLISPAGNITHRLYAGETISCGVTLEDQFVVGGRSGGLFQLVPHSGQFTLLRRFSSPVEKMASIHGRLYVFMESGEFFIE